MVLTGSIAWLSRDSDSGTSQGPNLLLMRLVLLYECSRKLMGVCRYYRGRTKLCCGINVAISRISMCDTLKVSTIVDSLDRLKSQEGLMMAKR